MKCLFLVLLLALATSSPRRALALGGERVYFTTPGMTPNVSHRQSVCERYESFQNGTVELKDALEGLQLHVIFGNKIEFNYNKQTGINKDYPGLLAVVMDELARRGHFTWRDTFGIFDQAGRVNTTLDEVLSWSADTYDLSANWWTASTERMKSGVTFLEPFLDSSPILIGKQQQQTESDSGVSLFAWLKPYDLQVWMMTIVTILLSGLVYMILEWFADEREERTLWEWWLENAYLSTINFTQAYEYQPKTLASRIFGISMAIWALVMTATYTANLASLLVDRSPPPPGPQTLAEVAVRGLSVCVAESSFPDMFIRNSYADVIRVQMPNYPSAFKGLRDGICDFAVAPVTLWNRVKLWKAFNPNCDLYWAGGDRRITSLEAGFATKADSGDKCTSFIQDVLNVHIRDMFDSGFLTGALERDDKLRQDIDCNAYRAGAAPSPAASPYEDENPNKSGRRNLLLMSNSLDHLNNKNGLGIQGKHHRSLKGGGKGAAGAAVANANTGGGSLSEDERKLSVEEMIGTFVFHWSLMAAALVIAGINALYVKYSNRFAPRKNRTNDPTPASCATNNDGKGSQTGDSSICSAEHVLEKLSNFEQQFTGLEIRMQQHLRSHEQKMLSELDQLRQQIQMLSAMDSSTDGGNHLRTSAVMFKPSATTIDRSGISTSEVNV